MAKYQIQAKAQARFNPSNGTYEPVPPYTGLKPIFGVRIEEGRGETDDRQTAIEFVDMGYEVVPNPKAEEEPEKKPAKKR